MKISKLSNNVYLKGGTIYDPFKKKSEKGNILITNGKINGTGDIKAPKVSENINCTQLIMTHCFRDNLTHFRGIGRVDNEALTTGA